MKVTLSRPDDVISINKNSAALEEETGDGFCVYTVRYSVDIRKAIQNEALIVKIHAAENPPIKKAPPGFRNQPSEAVIENLLTRAAAIKDGARSTESDYLVSITSDISSRIPNNITRQLNNENDNNTPLLEPQRAIIPKLVARLVNNDVVPPVLEINLAAVAAFNKINNNRQPHIDAQQLLHLNNIDPAGFIGQRTNTLAPAAKTLAGINVNNTFLQRNLTMNQPLVANLIGTLLNRNTATNIRDLNPDTYVNVVVQQAQELLTITEEIRIPSTQLNKGEFYFVFELMNDRNLVVQSLSTVVHHSRNLKLLRIPTEVPSVSLTPVNKPGRVAFYVKQNDKNGIGVNVYKKEVNPGALQTESFYKFVGRVIVGYKETQKLEDNCSSLHKFLYRFIPFADEDKQSSIFSSQVVNMSLNNSLRNIKAKRRQHFVVLSYEVKNTGIEISIKDIPTGVISVELLRRNKTIRQKSFDRVKNTSYLISTNSNVPLTIEDTDVTQNRIYEYRVKLMYKDGTTEFTNNNLIVEYLPIVNNIINMTISKPVIITGNQIDATFDISYNLIKDKFENLKQFIAEQNLTEFQQQITDNKDKLTKLFVFEVIRTNMTSGDIESFGVINSLTFSDRKFGVLKNVNPLQPGYEYRYTINAYFRNPETMFENLERTVETTYGDYTFKPNKWLNPVILGIDGSIVTENSLIRNHSKNELLLGSLAEIQHVDISLIDMLPTISDSLATQIRRRAILIQWKVQGNVTKIDHFIIILESVGIRTIVGSAHNISNSNYFEFLDPLTNDEHGALTYIIIPVYYDYNRGVELKTNQVII